MPRVLPAAAIAAVLTMMGCAHKICLRATRRCHTTYLSGRLVESCGDVCESNTCEPGYYIVRKLSARSDFDFECVARDDLKSCPAGSTCMYQPARGEEIDAIYLHKYDK